MFQGLDTTLKAILDDASMTKPVRDADVSFDRPSDTYNPDKTTVNLFLYDIRENAELRSNEPFIERNNGMATMRRPPIRVNCSYLVTAWIEAGVTGEEAILRQHELLGEVMRVFCTMPTVETKYLQGDLKNQSYPIPLVTAQGELIRNPAEFWSALGGKLRPSITLTATLALERDVDAKPVREVASREIRVEQLPKDSGDVEVRVQIGGTVRDTGDGRPIAEVVLTLKELGLQTKSDVDGRYLFAGVAAGAYTIEAVKGSYSPQSRRVEVPGQSPAAFDFTLSPSA